MGEVSTAIIVALITGGLSLIGTIYATKKQSDITLQKIQHQSEIADERLTAKLDKHQAVTDTKIEELTREVRKHNNFAERMPVMEEQIKVANHRIEDLEKKVG